MAMISITAYEKKIEKNLVTYFYSKYLLSI